MVVIFLLWFFGEVYMEVYSFRVLKFCGEVIFLLYKFVVKIWGKKMCGCLLFFFLFVYGVGVV